MTSSAPLYRLLIRESNGEIRHVHVYSKTAESARYKGTRLIDDDESIAHVELEPDPVSSSEEVLQTN
jgi:hypothetical protein